MINRKGIILAGGLGTRMYPLNITTSKQLLPVYNKPMIYYPMTLLINSGIKDICIISSIEYINLYKKLFATGRELGVKVRYLIQRKPKGIAESLIIAKNFIKTSPICLVLGDNLIFGNNKEIERKLVEANKNEKATIFVSKVKNPNQYGVIKKYNNSKSLVVEKPKKFISNKAVIGIYFYPNKAISFAKKLKPSKRNELEITDLNNIFLKLGEMNIKLFSKQVFWYDAGTHINYFQVSKKIYDYEINKGFKVGNVHMAALKKGLISKKKFNYLASKYNKSTYFS